VRPAKAELMRPTRQFTRFLAVGTLGFIVDAGTLLLLVSAGGDPYVMRLVSFAVAVSVTWWCNRNWTFRSASRLAWQAEYLRYFGVQAAGAAVNYAFYAGVLTVIGLTALNLVLALAVGSFVALVVNFSGARALVFKPRPA